MKTEFSKLFSLLLHFSVIKAGVIAVVKGRRLDPRREGMMNYIRKCVYKTGLNFEESNGYKSVTAEKSVLA